MDPNAPHNVTQGTLITSATLSIGASLYGAIKGLPITPFAASAGVNSGITAATFFSVREYFIGPILVSILPYPQFSRRRQELEYLRAGQEPPEVPLSWSDMRLYKVPDTSISGAITGGVLNAWKRGRPGIIPGIVTGSILCTMLQFAYNEFGIARVKYVSQTLGSDSTQHAGPSLPRETSLSISSEPLRSPEVVQTESFSERIFSWFGLHRVADEEYLERLTKQRDAHLRRIAELEKELEQERGNGSTS